MWSFNAQKNINLQHTFFQGL